MSKLTVERDTFGNSYDTVAFAHKIGNALGRPRWFLGVAVQATGTTVRVLRGHVSEARRLLKKHALDMTPDGRPISIEVRTLARAL